jgi:hypothetical protein
MQQLVCSNGHVTCGSATAACLSGAAVAAAQGRLLHIWETVAAAHAADAAADILEPDTARSTM